jgi:hypothetical protein
MCQHSLYPVQKPSWAASLWPVGLYYRYWFTKQDYNWAVNWWCLPCEQRALLPANSTLLETLVRRGIIIIIIIILFFLLFLVVVIIIIIILIILPGTRSLPLPGRRW